MSLFGTSPTEDHADTMAGRSRTSRGGGLFDDSDDGGDHNTTTAAASTPSKRRGGGGLFADDGHTGGDDESSPWDMPTPRKRQSRAEMVRNLLPSSAVPESYVETFDTIVRMGDGSGRRIGNDGLASLFSAARVGAEAQKRIVELVTDGGAGSDAVSLGREEFNVVLALVGLAQEGEAISLDGVDERRRKLPEPKLAGLTAEPVLPPVDELSAKPPQTPIKDTPPNPRQDHTQSHSRQQSQQRILRSTMDDPEDDPWNSPDVHKGHAHGNSTASAKAGPNGSGHHSVGATNGFADVPSPTIAGRNLSQYATETSASSNGGAQSGGGPGGAAAAPGGWGYFDGNTNSDGAANAGSGFPDPSQNPTSPFGGGDAPGQAPGGNPPIVPRSASGRTGGVEENIIVTLMPEKEGVFMFQHHNYEVASQRRASKVVRRYSDFVWLLDCLQKRYPFRILPLLPPKRVAVNGNHLSNDTSFIEKRRRGLARFLNALVRHPILGQEQLVVMFLTVPTDQELSVWRKQATISIQDEFAERALPPGLEDSLPASLEELFSRTRSGVRRSAELYTNVCNIMNRLIKRSEGVAADHGRVAASLGSVAETSSDTYATDTNEIPLLNDGLAAMSRHLKNAQTLLEDEARGWDEGVLEDLKRQRDALVSVQEMFDRRERLDKDNIPYLERRIQTNETKLASLRSKPEGTVKAGEVEKVAEAIIKDKESIVQQHNRSIFVKETIRDELITFQATQYQVSRWNQDWAGERVKYSEMLADNWRRLIDGLEGMPLGD